MRDREPSTLVGNADTTQEAIDICWIEDDAEFVTLLSEQLAERSPPMKISVTDGTTDLNLERVQQDYDCILVDYMLDTRTGISHLKAIRDEYAELPVILLTGYGSEDIASRAIEHGVTEYLPKSLVVDKPELIADRIETAVCDYRRKRQTQTLNRIQQIIGIMSQNLVTAQTVADIDDAVCEVFSTAEPYVFAWIGDHDAEQNRVTPRAYAGIEAGYLDTITITTDTSPTAQGPTGRALITDAIAVMQDIQTDPRYEPWREQALERGYRSSAAIPIDHQEHRYGVLNIYANRKDAFGEEELALLQQAGETIAAALHRISVEQELRQAESAIAHAADAILILDHSGRIEYVNPAFESMTGQDAHAVVDTSFDALPTTTEDDREMMWETVQNGETWHGEIVAKPPGAEFVASQTIAPIGSADASIDGYVVILRDITEHRKHERQIEEHRNRLRVLFDGAPDGIVVHDAGGSIIDVNETLSEMLGYSPDELLEMNVQDFEKGVQIADLEDMWESMHQGPMEKITVVGEHQRRDGSTYPVDVWVSRLSVQPEEEDHYIALIRDISDQKDRQQQLDLFERAVEEAGHAVIITDREGVIEYVNPAFEAMSGYSSADAIGQTPRILKSGKHPDAFYSELWETITAGDIWRTELQNRAKDGSLFYVDQTISSVANDAGTITHFIGIESEITDRRLREQRLDVLMRILRHNLRNSMTVILGRTDLLYQMLEDPTHTEQLEMLQAEAQKLVHVGEKIRTVRHIFENVEAGGTIDLDPCVDDVVSEILAEYPQATIAVQDEPLGRVKGDDRLKIGIREALENAIVHNDQTQPHITIDSTVDSTVDHPIRELLITDNGPGIPEGQREVIERGHETALMHTTGLGLWIITWAAATTGGEISFADSQSEGSSVVFRLPVGGATQE